MKKALLSLVVIGIVVFITVLSCKKASYNSGATNNMNGTTPSLNQLFSGLHYTPQALSVTAGRDTIVYGAKGTMLHFYTNSFKDANGNIITAGTINLQLVEMYKPGDMISNRTTTTANGQILVSGGEITMTATLNGQQVFANKYGIGYKQAGSSTAPMGLFYGGTNNADSVTTWAQADSTQNGAMANGTITDSTHNVSLYIFDTCTNFTWANCDWFYNSDSGETSVSVILPDTSFNPTNTQLYLVLPNIGTFNAVLSNVEPGLGSGSYVAATNTLKLISEGNTAIVPAGMNYELVMITNKNGTYYYYGQSGTIPHNGLIATAAMAQSTLQAIQTKLAAL